jgi:DNA segregation ATPase FtsK/SpoIIIE, S-DNA-T family
VHGPFVADDEVREVAEYLRKQAKPNYIEDVTIGEDDEMMLALGGGDGMDDLYQQAVSVVLRDKKVSTSYIQRVFKIGYNRAANIIDQMEQQGVISAPDHVGRRQILLK